VGDDRVRRIVAGLPANAEANPAPAGVGRARGVSAQIVTFGGEDARPARVADRRSEGVGSRFRAAPIALSKGHVS
jgi:hypothetical protein